MEVHSPCGPNAAAQQVHDVICSLDRDGSTPVLSRNPEASDFRRVSIPTGEGEALRQWVIHENATQTIEIGLAFGFSALHICEGLLLNENPNPKHVVLDPHQSLPSGYANYGLEILENAGVSFVEFHSEYSQIALPHLLKAGCQFDMAFIDGNHRFDAVFLDLYYLGQLVRKGGLIILDDYNYPGPYVPIYGETSPHPSLV